MTEENNDITRKLSPATQEVARGLWERIPAADKREIQNLIRALPNQNNMMKLLLRLATSQYRTAFGRKHRVAIVGPTNVGKSTLYNQLVQNKEDRAEVSPIPGTTRVNQSGDAGLFTLVDTPGADAVGPAGENEQEIALAGAADADFLIIVFDAIQGVKRTELELFERLVALGKPYVVVMNKIDLVRREQKRVIEGAAAALHIEPDQVIPVIARTGENLDVVLSEIALTQPEIVAALGEALPQYRWQLSWRTIVSSASAAAVIALTPLPVIDFIPLTITQSMMVLSIARIYNHKITLRRARELLVTFGLGFLGRALFQQLSKLGGIPGDLLSAVIAASTTVVMGYAASVWFETGERVSGDTLKRLNQEVGAYLLGVVKSLGKRRPGKTSLKKQIAEALEKAPLPKKPSEAASPKPAETAKPNKE